MPGGSIHVHTTRDFTSAHSACGGMLSHGAIIAREFGIPAIVNVKNATKRITSGQNISINGNDGTIYF